MDSEKRLEILKKYPEYASLYEELKRFQMDPILQERYDRRWIDLNQSAHTVEKLEQALKELEQLRLLREQRRMEKEQALKDAQLAQEKVLQLQEILKMHGIDVP